jgi:hypothetical protein
MTQDGNGDLLLVAHGDIEEDDPGQCRHDQHQAGRDVFGCLGADGRAAEAHDQRADNGQEDDKFIDEHDVLSPSSC